LRRARQRLREGYPRADNVINALAFMEWRWEEANHFLNTMISKLLNTSCSYSVRSAGWMAHRDKTWEEDLRLYIDLLYLLYSDSLEFLLMTDGLVAWRWRWWDDKREAVPCLCRILIDARTPSHFRKAVADALGQLGYREAVPYLCQHLVDNYTDAHDYGMTAAEVLGRLNDRQVVADLCQILVNVRTSGTIRMIVAWVLGHLGDRRAVSNLCQILTDPRDDTYDYSWAAAEALGRLGDRQAVPYLCQVLTAPHDDNNNSIHFGTGLSPDSDLGIILGPLLAMLRWLGEGKTVPYLCKILADVRVSFARTAAAWMLGLLGNRQAVPYLRETLADPRVNWVARQAAAWALQQLGGVHSPLVRAVVVKALGQLGDRQAIPYLCEILVDPHAHRDVRAIAEKVLWRLGSGQAVLTSCQPVVDTAVGIHKTAALMLDQLGFGQTVPYLRKCLGHKPIYDEDGFRRNPEPLEALALKALEALDRRLRTEKEGLGV
jgi:HEAT repeat protein